MPLSGDELTFIVGGDMAISLRPGASPEAFSLPRSASPSAKASARDILDRSPTSAPTTCAFFDMPRLDISSSQIRRRVTAGRPIRIWCRTRSRTTIEHEGLYR
jgi:nicotinic acid mononucleotide adenylyltransferase